MVFLWSKLSEGHHNQFVVSLRRHNRHIDFLLDLTCVTRRVADVSGLGRAPKFQNMCVGPVGVSHCLITRPSTERINEHEDSVVELLDLPFGFILDLIVVLEGVYLIYHV